MIDDKSLRAYNRARLNDRQVTELIGIARGVLADDFLADEEVMFLQKWLVANEEISSNPLLSNLSHRLSEILEDNKIEEEERASLFHFLSCLVSNDFEIGELVRSTTLPICTPPPHIEFDSTNFCFTGSFAFGTRQDCAQAVTGRGGSEGNLTRSTDFLVIGEYATESWVQSTYGRKIEKAVEMREAGLPISIVSEAHWSSSLW